MELCSDLVLQYFKLNSLSSFNELSELGRLIMLYFNNYVLRSERKRAKPTQDEMKNLIVTVDSSV